MGQAISGVYFRRQFVLSLLADPAISSVYFRRQFVAACSSTLTYAHSWQRPCTPTTCRSIHHTLPSLATKILLRIGTWCLSQDVHRSLRRTMRNVSMTIMELRILPVGSRWPLSIHGSRPCGRRHTVAILCHHHSSFILLSAAMTMAPTAIARSSRP